MEDVLRVLEEAKVKEQEQQFKAQKLKERNGQIQEINQKIQSGKERLHQEKCQLLELRNQVDEGLVDKEILELKIAIRKGIFEDMVKQKIRLEEETRDKIKNRVQMEQNHRREVLAFTARQATLPSLVQHFAVAHQEREMEVKKRDQMKSRKEELIREADNSRNELRKARAILEQKKLEINEMAEKSKSLVLEPMPEENESDKVAAMMKEIEALESAISEVKRKKQELPKQPRVVKTSDRKETTSLSVRVQPYEANLPHGFQTLTLDSRTGIGPSGDQTLSPSEKNET